MNNGKIMMAAAGILAIGAAFGACGDDDDAGNAEALGDSYQEFTAALARTTDVGTADGDDQDTLKDNCGDLADAVDDDAFSDFCGDLGDAIDDEDQPAFDAAKAQFASFDGAVRAAVGSEIADVANDDDDGDDDNNDDNDDDADEGITDNDSEDLDGDGENDDDQDDDPLTQ